VIYRVVRQVSHDVQSVTEIYTARLAAWYRKLWSRDIP